MTIAVAMSGGVDSSTVAAMLKAEGHELIGLDLKGLAVSSGAACSSGANEPSHVLAAMGLPVERARASLRFSLHRETSAEEIERTIALVSTQVAKLRELSAVTQ